MSTNDMLAQKTAELFPLNTTATTVWQSLGTDVPAPQPELYPNQHALEAIFWKGHEHEYVPFLGQITTLMRDSGMEDQLNDTVELMNRAELVLDACKQEEKTPVQRTSAREDTPEDYELEDKKDLDSRDSELQK